MLEVQTQSVPLFVKQVMEQAPSHSLLNPLIKCPLKCLAPCKQIAARCSQMIASESWHFAAMIDRLRGPDPHQPALADREYVRTYALAISSLGFGQFL
ncbi:hypothetical protein, partial [Thermoleptolyngbya sp. M55_K2018_002]|uniref:hypothetical protein n=1 Tax=Thermoleptolyngbya sp. M55_K2018_002 TaxID=2747808 RepID=UPI0025E9F9AF